MEKSQPQPYIYLRNIERAKKEKKSWYQYVFLRLVWENEATEEVRSIRTSSPKPSDQSTETLSVRLVRMADSFILESASIEQGDCFRVARHPPGIGWKRHGSNLPDPRVTGDLRGFVRFPRLDVAARRRTLRLTSGAVIAERI